MNRRLFWKIFLPFWVAQALVAGRALHSPATSASHAEQPLVGAAERAVMPHAGALGGPPL